MSRKQKKMLIRILIATALMIILLCLPLTGWVRFVAFMLPYLCVGYDILIKAGKGIISLQPFDENFLMAVATVGAIVLQEYTEGVAVMLLYQIGELFQSYAVGKSRRSISALMDIRPDSANLEMENGEIEERDPDDVPIGSIIVVRPGEKIPIDGVVEEGKSTLNTVSLTGESMPRSVNTGESVISGCVNLTGLLRVRTTKAFGESTVSKILDLVENASSKKSRSEHFIAKFARIYTPAVCFSALALAILPPIIRMLFLSAAPAWGEWIYRALTFLVISCPCALVISVPLTFFAGIGGASRMGVLIKGSNYIETLSKVKIVAFDKTGTLTCGVFAVESVYSEGIDENTLLEYAAAAERYSTHPIAESLRAAVGASLEARQVTSVREVSGEGVEALVDGTPVAVGNAKMMRRMGVKPYDVAEIGSVVHVAIGGVYRGAILVSDYVKPHAKEALQRLEKIGVSRTVMLTGDSRVTGEAVAESLGIHEALCELLPQNKLEEVERMLTEKPNGAALAFVGDGINDAPVLSRADVGIAMGAMGADAAIEAADVVLMDDDPVRLVSAIGIAKKCLRIVYQNIVLALGIKLVCLALGAFGYANMWLAIFADVGVMVLAVLNAIRAMKYHR